MNNLPLIVLLALLSACTTVTYPNGTTVTTPYVASFYAPVYGTLGYPVPVAPYSPPGTPGVYYGYGVGYTPLIGFGWGNWGRWWGGCYGGNYNHWNGWNGNCHNAYRGNYAYGGCRYGH